MMNITEIDDDDLSAEELARIYDETCLCCKRPIDGKAILVARLKHRTLWWHDRPNQNSPSCATIEPRHEHDYQP